MFSQIKRLPLLAALMLYAVSASAEDRYTLDDLIKMAVEKNPSVAIFRANVEARKGVVVSSRAYPNPELGIEAGRGRSLDGPDSGGEYSISIGQPIERPAKRHFREKAAETGVLSSEKEKEGYLLLLRSDVKKGFYRLLYDKRAVKAAGENIGIMDGLLKTAEVRVKAGEAPEFELVKARVEKLRVDKELKRAESRVITSKAALNVLFGNTLPENFDIEGDFFMPEKRFDLQSLLANAVEKHPRMLKARREAEAKGYTLKMEEASVFPGITLKGFAGRELGREWYGIGQVLIYPDRLRKYDLSLKEVFDAVASNNANAGGNIIEHASEQYIVRGVGLIKSIQDIGDIVVKEHGGTPVFVKDVADVKFGPDTRQGAVVKDGKGEAVAGIVMMIKGGNSKEIVAGVKARVDEINRSNILPEGLKIKPFYDRTDLVEKCIETVTKALEEGAILVVVILYLFLRNFRGALVVALTLPLAVLSTFIIMWKTGLSANLMSLGGLAISLGMVVDAAIIQVENVQRHLSERGAEEHRLPVILESILEVRKPSLFGELIIAITFIPIMTLQGMEGKMFAPLAFTVVIALFSSLILSIFVIPVLCSFIMKGGEEKESPIIHWLKIPYIPVLIWAIGRPKVITAIAAGLLAGSLALFPFLGTEFIPTLDEGSLTTQVIRLPSINLTESVEIEKKM
ncbi:MAG: efflux RND transporter permease subunit, partial [Nitrospinae bacterium]|nr:efflux RND transporter permease subunit [Nitrospinota bacterium]